MKQTILYILLLILSLSGTAQTKDLNFFLEQAEKNSPLLNNLKNDTKIIHLNLKNIKRILFSPKVSFETNVLFAPIISHDNNRNQFQPVSEGTNNYSGYDFAYTDGGQYQTYFSVNQALFKGKYYKDFAKQTDIFSRLNENKINIGKHETEQLVRYQYLLCLRSKKQAEIAMSLLKQMQESLKIMKILVKNAVYKQSDLMLLQIENQNYNFQYKTYLSDYKSNISDLKLLCGTDEEITDIQYIELTIKPDTIIRSQFVKKYELDSLQINTEQTIFEQKYKPQINLYADAGMKSVYIPTYKRFGISAGINLSWNIYDGNQRKIEKEKTLVKQQSINFEKQNFIIRNKLSKKKYTEQIDALNEKITITEQQLNMYNQLFDVYKLKLSQGQVSIMDLKNLMKDISSKKQENLALKSEKQIIINLYNYQIF